MYCLNIGVLLAIVATGQEPDSLIKPEDPAKYATYVAKGRAEAEVELGEGEASIWRHGKPTLRSLIQPIDRETGLYFSSRAGCLTTPEIRGRVEGHNARIAEDIRDHGPPKNSFKPWEKELFALKAYFEGRCRTEEPIRLIVGSQAVSSPGGEYTVKLVKRRGLTMDGVPTERDWIVVGEKDIESQSISLWLEDAELLWGPKGSWFAIIKGTSMIDGCYIYKALDLRQVRTIRAED